MERATLTRRSFVKAAAVAGAAIATSSTAEYLVPATKAFADADTGQTEIVQTVCRACIAQCTVLAHVRDGRVIKLEGDPAGPMSQGRICAKGLAGIQALYNPNRNKYPMKRVGERGVNSFERLSWDEATDQIADVLMDHYDKYGPESVWASTGGGGNPHISGPIRFINTFQSPNNFEPGCAQCYLPRQTQARLVYGGGKDDNLSIADSNVLEYYYTDTEADACVLWGAGPSWSGPSMTGRAMAALRERPQGLKTVVIDPRFTADAAKADIWLPIRTGTDVALMMCWIKYIIDNKLYDSDFDKRWTNLPFLVDPDTKYCLKADVIGGSSDNYVVYDAATKSVKELPYPCPDDFDPELFGTFPVAKSDGTTIQCRTGYQWLKDACDEWTLDKAAEVCWLEADKIEKAIRIYTDNPHSTLIHGLATDQFVGSAQAALAALELECMMGHVQSPGSALQAFGQLSHDAGIIPNDTFGMGCLQALITRKMLNTRLVGGHNGFYNWQMAHIPTVLNAIKTGEPYKPRVWMERSGNKLAVIGNARSWYEVLPEVDMVVHSYMYPTSFTIEAADYVLPMREWLECPKPVKLMNWVFPRREVVHLYETCDETLMWSRIVAKLAERGHEAAKKSFDWNVVAPNKSKMVGNFEIGIENGYPWAHDEDELMEEFMDKMVDPDTGADMTFPELLEKGPVEFAPTDEWRQYYVYKKTNPATGKPYGFGTVSGRVEPYNDITVMLGRTGFPFSLCDEGCIELDPSLSREYEPVPYYEEPAESPLTDTEYPLSMTEGRVPYYHHGTLRNIPWLREIQSNAEIWINPVDADKYGLANDDWVLVESRRGETYAKAVVTNGIAKGNVYQERFWYPELLDTDPYGSWNAGNVNVLTKNDPPYNDVYGTYTLRGFQVKISKADSCPYDIWTKPEQFEPWLPEYTETNVEDSSWCPDPLKM